MFVCTYIISKTLISIYTHINAHEEMQKKKSGKKENKQKQSLQIINIQKEVQVH